jgi:pilus assembly protein CpaE
MDLDRKTPRMVALVGAKGGCGTTLLTVNLAAAQVGERRVCVVDMDFFKGDVAGALDVWPTRTMHEIMVDPSRLDDELLRGTAVTHDSGLLVLAQPHDLAQVLQVGTTEVDKLVTALGSAFDLCFVDCGSRMDEVAAATALRADLVLIVATPEVGALRDAGRAIDLLRGLGLPPSKLRLVINKRPRRLGVSLSDAADHLGIRVAATITRDDDACGKADAAGKLLRVVAPRADVTGEIAALWDRLTRAPQVDVPLAAAWTLSRLLGR